MFKDIRLVSTFFRLASTFIISTVCCRSLKAFIYDSTRLEYEASRHCSLATVGELFGRSGYGIGFARDSPWADKITLDILHFHESKYFECYSLNRQFRFPPFSQEILDESYLLSQKIPTLRSQIDSLTQKLVIKTLMPSQQDS